MRWRRATKRRSGSRSALTHRTCGVAHVEDAEAREEVVHRLHGRRAPHGLQQVEACARGCSDPAAASPWGSRRRSEGRTAGSSSCAALRERARAVRVASGADAGRAAPDACTMPTSFSTGERYLARTAASEVNASCCDDRLRPTAGSRSRAGSRGRGAVTVVGVGLQPHELAAAAWRRRTGRSPAAPRITSRAPSMSSGPVVPEQRLRRRRRDGAGRNIARPRRRRAARRGSVARGSPPPTR